MFCDNYKCMCKAQRKPDKANLRRTEDLADVSLLPYQWTPRRSGPILTNYLKEREENHKNVLCNMSESTNFINEDINTKIRELSEILYAHLKDNHHNIECIINNNFTVADKVPNDREVFLKEVDKLHDQAIEDIIQFKYNALHLEHHRSDFLKIELRRMFLKSILIGYCTPKDLLHDFDERIYQINYQLLSNHKAYIELEAQLRVVLNEITLHARSVLHQLYLPCDISSGQKTVLWHQKRSIFHKKVVSEYAYKDRKILDGEDDVNGREHEKVMACLEDTYHKAISVLYTEFFKFAEDLENNIKNPNFDNINQVASGLENALDVGLLRIFNCCLLYNLTDNDDVTHNRIEDLKKKFCTLRDGLQSSYNVLYDARLFCNSHRVRLSTAQKLVLANIEDLQTQYDENELTSEISFNIALEQMRGAPDIEKVHHQFDIIVNLLQKQEDYCFEHSISEVNKLKEFLNLVPHVIDILYLEYACYFKVKHNIMDPINEENINNSSSEVSVMPTLSSFLNSQNEIIQILRNKFLVNLDDKILSLPDIINKKYRKWIDENCLILNMRYSLKIMSHTIRKERVMTARDARIAEIRLHESCLKSHLDALYHLIESVQIEASAFISLDSNDLYPLSYWVSQIQNNVNELFLANSGNGEMKRLKLSSYALRLSKYRQLFEESLESAVNTYKNNLEKRIHSARISNFKFMEQLKLFNEGGRYAVMELNKASAALMKAADALELCLSGSMEAVNRCRSHILSLAEQQLLPLTKVVGNVGELHTKTSGKTTIEKKKTISKQRKK